MAEDLLNEFYAEFFDKDFRAHQEEKVLTNKALRRYEAAFGLVSGLKVNKALDLGCANGLFARILKGNVAHDVSGIDVSESAIRSARERFPEIEFKIGNLIRIPYQDSIFGLVSCLDVIYYLDNAGRRKAVDEIARVLKPDGYLLISTSWPRFTKTRTGTSYIQPTELRRLLANRFDQMFSLTGFKEATTDTIRGLPFIRSGVAMLLHYGPR